MEKLDGPAVNALRRAIAKVKQHSSVIGWVTKNLHGEPLLPAAFAVVCTHRPAQSWRGCVLLFFLCVIHKEDLCPSSGDINRLMMIIGISFLILK
jgi:hypothetical protein